MTSMWKKTIAFTLALSALSQTVLAGDWVLWEHVMKGLASGHRSLWVIVESFPNYEMCVRRKDETLNAMKKHYRIRQKNYKVRGDSAVLLGEDGRLVEERVYYCLPATIDPREKK